MSRIYQWSESGYGWQIGNEMPTYRVWKTALGFTLSIPGTNGWTPAPGPETYATREEANAAAEAHAESGAWPSAKQSRHALAAKVLEALAAPGVPLAIRALANNPSVILSGSSNTMELNADQRAALRTLADAAKETP